MVVLVHDLSRTGLLIETSANLAVGADLEIDLPEAGLSEARVVWNSGHYFGCQFHHPLSKGGLSAALLKSPSEAVPADETSALEEQKFSLRTRAAIIVGLALASWAIVLTVFFLV